jgi:hypothetical protein
MNQVEEWFSIFARQRLSAPNFADLADLEAKVHAFIADWNKRAHPFRWTQKSFDKILAKTDEAIRRAAGVNSPPCPTTEAVRQTPRWSVVAAVA